MTENNEKTISNTLIELNRYQRKYRNIKKIIVTDKNSKDKTIPLTIETINQLQNPTIMLITNPKNPKEALKHAFSYINNPNIIQLPPYPETNLNQIQKQIKLLRRTHLVLPNRHHPNTPNRYLPIKEEDFSNPNIGYKTQIIQQIMDIKHIPDRVRVTRTNTHIKKL